MATWMLEGWSTDRRGEDVRYRDYTRSEKRAERFKKVPRISFTDSGHGIVFSAYELQPREHRKPKISTLADHVREHGGS